MAFGKKTFGFEKLMIIPNRLSLPSLQPFMDEGETANQFVNKIVNETQTARS